VNLVLDASAGFELLLTTTTGQAILRQVPPRAEWWVPEHYFIEVAGAIRRAEYTKAITSAQAVSAFDALQAGRLHRVQVRPLLDEAWVRRGHLTVADAVYVILAEQLGARLVTADRKLARSPGLRVPTITVE
jgi:predicted nucleic acid-binding protein